MANVFEISKTYLAQIENYQDETSPLSKILENSQNVLFRAYLARRKNNKVGYFDEEIVPFVLLRYYVGDGRFILFDLNAYKNGWHAKEEEKPEPNEISSPVLDLLDETSSFTHQDVLANRLESYPTLTDWFKKLLDKIPEEDREKISLDGVKVKKYQEVLEEEKKKLVIEEKDASPAISPQKVESKPLQKEKKAFKKKQETKKVQVKTVSFNKSDDLEEKKLIALQNRATELNNRIKKRVGIHFGWDELFVYAQNGDAMLTMIDKKVRKKGLKSQDKDWIIVATYTVEDEDFLLIKEHYPDHTFRSDDILHKPSAEFVSLAIVVSPVKKMTSKAEDGVKKVSQKAVSFVNIVPETGYSASDDPLLNDDEEEEEIIKRPVNDGIIRKVKYKGANINHYEEPKSYSVPNQEEDEGVEESGTYSNPNGEYGIDNYSTDENEVEIPKHWKCPFCPSKNPWHTEEPARIVKNPDGSYTFLCKKHKNNSLN